MSTFGDLIRKLRKDRSMTLEQVARKVGSHKGYVSGIENGKVNPPSVKFIRKFSKLFAYDERTMVRMAYLDKAPKLVKEEIARIVAGASPASGLAAVPLLNTLETGYTTELADGKPKALSSAVLQLPRGSAPIQYAVTVSDASMERPEGLSLAKGDIALLAPVERLRNGSLVFVIYTAKTHRTALLRQVMLEQNDHVVLQPLNKEFPLEFLTHDDIDAAWQVVGRIEHFEEARVNSAV